MIQSGAGSKYVYDFKEIFIEGFMAYLYLFIAIIAEVVGTSALKASDGFTKWIPNVIIVIGYGLAFYFLSLVLRSIPVGVAYAIWSGLGIVLISLVGYVYFKQPLDLPAIVGMVLIISGVILINIFSKTVSH
jgi:small multidrug resistance pump